ncbi:MAG: carbohydrate-binding protein [Bombella apis]|uniref:glycoside hydrolase family 66 protein n=1 Tax=Bombella apis TaxID=1785988 RepID=UPI0023F11728|nr:glycoside hydrolase family 66 protein [Bombella apis]MCT6819161.1 carbohydrate-binding protein [Bombella apis]
MKKTLTATALLLGMAGSAHAGILSGPLIRRVIDDRAFYQPGDRATISIEMTNTTGADFNGKLNLTTCSRGHLLAIDAHNVSIPDGASQTSSFTITVPSLVANGYQLSINALQASDSGYAMCTGTGSSSSDPVDVASGAINVANHAQDDPIEGFVDPQAMQSVTDYEAVARNMAQYHINIVQFYDWGSRHDAPYTDAASWRNLQNVTVTREETAGLVGAFRRHGIFSQLYTLWNGAYADWPSRNPNVTIGMGAFRNRCGLKGTCTSADQISIGGNWKDWGWAIDGIVQENPANGRWQKWITSQYLAAMKGWGFDGVHLDTLGDPGMPAHDAKGRRIDDFGSYLADFANQVQAATGVCTDINQVSTWNLQDEAVRGNSCNLYVEPHPEFGDNAYFPSFNGLMEQAHEWTSRPLIVAYYPQQVMSGSLEPDKALSGDTVPFCNPEDDGGQKVCPASSPGIELLLGQVAVSGASELMLGDIDHLIPGPFFSRPTLKMGADLQQFMADYYNWFVAFRDLLRGHSVDTPDIVFISDSSGQNIGASDGNAGKVYYHPWDRAGVAEGVSLTNLVGLKDNRIDDPDGTHSPIEQKNIRITMQLYGGRPTGQAWYAAPDYNHGFPQPLSYSVGTSGSDGFGNPVYTATFTIPSLKTSGIAWVEGNTLKNRTDWTLDGTASDLIRGGTPSWSPNGMGGRVAATVHGCCGRGIYWDGIDFGQGVSSLAAVTYSQHGGVMEFRLDSQDGPVLARLTVPQSKGGNVDSSQTQIIQSPTGVHRVWVVFPGQDVSLYGWRP